MDAINAYNFIALVSKFKFDRHPTFILTCDSSGLHWLIDQFRTLANSSEGSSFVIGNGDPIESDGRCYLAATKSDAVADDQIQRTGEGRFCWYLPLEGVNDVSEKLDALLLSNRPGHQYFDLMAGQYRTVVVTKYEESRDIVRAMRDDIPIS